MAINQLNRYKGSIKKKRLTIQENNFMSVKDELIALTLNEIKLRSDNNNNLIYEFENIQKGIRKSWNDNDLDNHYAKIEPFLKRFYRAFKM